MNIKQNLHRQMIFDGRKEFNCTTLLSKLSKKIVQDKVLPRMLMMNNQSC